MRVTQLPVSAARWQHGSQIWFATFFAKNQKIAKNSAATRAKEKIRTDYESLELFEFFIYVWLNFKTVKFYLINVTQNSTDNHSIY
jgi:hypothetical protein